ncbi:hypothetical protein BD779DRAFT_1549366 [Infundibulicybe gibba]|nr:hypothetical protein BD779DRAFT_1549366 [Infundibulicybe gibba]
MSACQQKLQSRDIDECASQHPLVAAVSNITNGSEPDSPSSYERGGRNSQSSNTSARSTPPKTTSNSILSMGGTSSSCPRPAAHLKLLNPEQLWSIATQLVEAVAFLHQHGATHLDFKPGNVLFPTQWRRWAMNISRICGSCIQHDLVEWR